MKGILIDPVAKTVTAVEYDGDFTSIYKLIDARPFDVVRLGNYQDQNQAMYIDDEGLYREPQAFFKLAESGPYAGKALILGVNDAGESVETKLSVFQVAAMVSFHNLRVAGWSEVKESKDEQTGFFQITMPQPVFEEVEASDESVG